MGRFLHKAMPSPAMVVATAALFAALGGTSYAALAGSGRTSSACSGSKLGGSVLVGAKSSFSRSFRKVSGFNCSGKAIEVRRLGRGHYRVKFLGNGGTIAVGSLDDPKTEVTHDFVTFTRVGPGDFNVYVYDAVIRRRVVAGRERPLGGAAVASVDRPFSILIVA
jgi:hypothetical protein